MANLPTPETASVNAGCDYIKDARFDTAEEIFYHLETTTNSSTLTSEENFGILQHINSKENNWTVNSEQKRKRNASSDQIIIHENTHKRSRSEICGKSNEVSTSSEQQGNENPDSRINITSASHYLLDNNIFTEKDPEIPCNEYSYFHNQEMKGPDLSNIRNLFSEQNTASNINFCQSVNPDILLDYQPSTSEDLFSKDATLASLSPTLSYENVSQSNLISEKVQNKLPYFHNQEMKGPDLSKIRYLFSEQNTASNINFCQSVNPDDILLDYQPSTRENLFSKDATLASLSPTLSYENISQSNLISEKLQNIFPFESQTAVETEKKPSTCETCRMGIAKNVNDCAGNIPEIYCQCKYTCDICGLRYRKEGSHEIEHTCNVCQQNFQCKTQLEDHYLIHEQHHKTYCRMCCRKLDEHVIRKETIAVKTYKCCQISCTFTSDDKFDFRRHLYRHSDLKLFKCGQCGWQFSVKAKLQNHSKYLCKCSG